jgi:hypothetical protein
MKLSWILFLLINYILSTQWILNKITGNSSKISKKVFRVTIHKNVRWLFLCVDKTPTCHTGNDHKMAIARGSVSSHNSLFAQKGKQVRPQNEAPLYFSIPFCLFFSRHNFSFRFLPFVTHCPFHSQVGPPFLCLLHGSQPIMLVDG